MAFVVYGDVVPAMSFQQIADELGIPLKKVRQIYHRAMKKLAERNWNPALDMIAVIDESREYARAVRTQGEN